MIENKTKFTFHLGPIFLLALLTILMTYPLIFHMKDHLPSDLGDPLHLVWLFGHTLNKVKEGLNNYWDGQIFYPHSKTLLYGDYIPFLSFLSLIPSFFSKNLIFTYNFLWLLSFFLSGLGGYLLIYHLTQSRLVSFTGALIFAFSPKRFAHLSHLELLFSAWLPFCFLFCHRFFKKPSLSNLSLTLLFFIFQALSCAHYGLYAAFFLALFGLVLSFYRGLWLNLSFWLKIIILIIVASALLFPFFWPYFPIYEKMGFTWTFNDVCHYSAELQNYISVPPWNLIYRRLLDTQALPEHQVFLGFIPILWILVWLFFNQFFYPSYTPFFIRGLTAWLKFKKGPANLKKLSIWLFIIDLSIFILILDILIILAIGGFDINLGPFRFSSHNLVNPILLFLILVFFRYSLKPGWLAIKRKIIFFLKTIRKKAKVSSLNIESSSFSDFKVNSDLYLSMALLSWLFSFGPIVSFKGTRLFIGPYYLLYHFFPGFNFIRVPSRFAMMMSLALSVLCGLAMASFLQTKRISFLKRPLIKITAILILLEQLSIPIPLAPLPKEGKVPNIYESIATSPSNLVLLELPLPENRLNYYQESLPMYYSLFHRHRIVNGYSAFIPPAYNILQEAMESFPNEATMALLQRLKIDLILVHTQGYRPQKGKEIVEALKAWDKKIVLLDHKEGDYLYQLRLETPLEQKNQISLDLTNQSSLKPFTCLTNKSLWRVWSSSNVLNASQAIDNSLDTGWSTAGLQKAGDFFWIDFGHEVVLTELRLYLKNKLFDYPRHFNVEISQDNINWIKIASYINYFPYFDLETIEKLSTYHVKIILPPTKLRFLRLKLTAGHPLYHWSIQEFEAFGKIDDK